MNDDEYRDQYALDNWQVISGEENRRCELRICIGNLDIQVEFLYDLVYAITFTYPGIKELTWFWTLSTNTQSFYEILQMPASDFYLSLTGLTMFNAANSEDVFEMCNAPETVMLHCFYWKDYHG